MSANLIKNTRDTCQEFIDTTDRNTLPILSTSKVPSSKLRKYDIVEAQNEPNPRPDRTFTRVTSDHRAKSNLMQLKENEPTAGEPSPSFNGLMSQLRPHPPVSDTTAISKLDALIKSQSRKDTERYSSPILCPDLSSSSRIRRPQLQPQPQQYLQPDSQPPLQPSDLHSNNVSINTRTVPNSSAPVVFPPSGCTLNQYSSHDLSSSVPDSTRHINSLLNPVDLSAGYPMQDLKENNHHNPDRSANVVMKPKSQSEQLARQRSQSANPEREDNEPNMPFSSYSIFPQSAPVNQQCHQLNSVNPVNQMSPLSQQSQAQPCEPSGQVSQPGKLLNHQNTVGNMAPSPVFLSNKSANAMSNCLQDRMPVSSGPPTLPGLFPNRMSEMINETPRYSFPTPEIRLNHCGPSIPPMHTSTNSTNVQFCNNTAAPIEYNQLRKEQALYAQVFQSCLMAQSRSFLQIQQTQSQLDQLIMTVQSVISERVAAMLTRSLDALKNTSGDRKVSSIVGSQYGSSTVDRISSSRKRPASNRLAPADSSDDSISGSECYRGIHCKCSDSESSEITSDRMCSGVEEANKTVVGECAESDSSMNNYKVIRKYNLGSRKFRHTKAKAFAAATSQEGAVDEDSDTFGGGSDGSTVESVASSNDGATVQSKLKNGVAISTDHISPVVMPLVQHKNFLTAEREGINQDEAKETSRVVGRHKLRKRMRPTYNEESSNSESDFLSLNSDNIVRNNILTSNPRIPAGRSIQYPNKASEGAKDDFPPDFDFSKVKDVFYTEPENTKSLRRFTQNAHAHWFLLHGLGSFNSMVSTDFQNAFVNDQRLNLKEYYNRIGFRIVQKRGVGYTCSKCSKTFKTRKLVQTHGLQYLPPGRKPFVCPACGICFSTDYSLTRHLSKLQSNTKRNNKNS